MQTDKNVFGKLPMSCTLKTKVSDTVISALTINEVGFTLIKVVPRELFSSFNKD